tara:strand:+ start:726 stop:1052 length:327 start_codon:yes stop_codon:yes gene_type:complete
MIKVQYIGEKPSKRDTVAGTGLVWEPEQSLEVEDAVAVKLLQFPSVWVKTELAEEPEPKKPAVKKAATPKKPAVKKAATEDGAGKQDDKAGAVGADGSGGDGTDNNEA